MDGQRFDTIAKSLASGMTRRHALRGLVAGIGGVALIQGMHDEGAARNRCCRQLKNIEAATNCHNLGGPTCTVINFQCTRRRRSKGGGCTGGWACEDVTKVNPPCH